MSGRSPPPRWPSPPATTGATGRSSSPLPPSAPVATITGAALAYVLVPMRSLGQDSWKVAAALMAVNYIAIAEAVGLSPCVLAAGVAADNLISVLYFMALFALASKIPAEAKTSQDDQDSSESQARSRLSVLQGGTVLSFIICKAGTSIAGLLGIQGGALPCITAHIIVLATAFPSQLRNLAPSGEAIALILTPVIFFFFCCIGANGNVVDAVTKAPSVSVFPLV